MKQSTAWKMEHAIREMTDGRDRQNPLLRRIVAISKAAKAFAGHETVTHSRDESAPT